MLYMPKQINSIQDYKKILLYHMLYMPKQINSIQDYKKLETHTFISPKNNRT